jgi:hypothetical protein
MGGDEIGVGPALEAVEGDQGRRTPRKSSGDAGGGSPVGVGSVLDLNSGKTIARTADEVDLPRSPRTPDVNF